jgi:acetyl esterase/lipase
MLGNLFDRLAQRNGRGDTPCEWLERWMPQPPLELHEHLPYGLLPRQRLDLYLPLDPKARRRLVVFLYGGGWDAGARRSYRFIGQMLAACGFAVAIPDYRLFPQARFPDFLEDTAKAVAWLHANASAYGVDGRRMALIGHSAGAYNAVTVSLDGRYLEAAGASPGVIGGVFGLAGPYAFNPLTHEETKPIFQPAEADPDRAQPLRLVHRHAPPMLLAHGTIDQRVAALSSVRLADALRAAGGEAQARLYSRHGHVGILLALANPFRRVARVLDDAVAFAGQATA